MFELRFLPNVNSFLFDNETWLRLRPIKQFLNFVDPKRSKRIIDIGGGSGRLELRLGRTDIYIYDSSEESISVAKHNFKNAIVGSGDNINFEDNSFDWAISIHTLEHIPKDKREFFILEMIRISKEGVFLNFPEGLFAEKLCHNFLNALEKNGLELNKWTIEHLEMGIPTVDEIISIIQKQNKFHFEYKLVRNYKAENMYWTRMRTSKNLVYKYITSPIFAMYKYLNLSSKPTVEMILVGNSTKEMSKEIIEKL
ncbi:MAG TPA: hypothetical protein DIW31_06665 [Bacteroidales bacterium]|nr:hypothetical protein [Bacteroidales bacterium]